MDLQRWLVGEIDDASGRLQGQVLSLVPAERRFEHPGGGNSITWACFHIARHADLALSVLSGSDLLAPPDQRRGGGGLEEEEQPWAGSEALPSGSVDAYLEAVLDATRRLLSTLGPNDLDRVPETAAALEAAGVGAADYPWLYRMWAGQPAAFFVRWPLVGHVGNHIGEMIATRNRMGLSPF
jgi:hypothetical protein